VELDRHGALLLDDLLHLCPPRLRQLAPILLSRLNIEHQCQPQLLGASLDGIENIAGQCRRGRAEGAPENSQDDK
jgi:hypothetical protein